MAEYDLLKKCNCPGKTFEILGYINVVIGIIIAILFLVNLPSTCSKTSGGGEGIGALLIALLYAVISAPTCFAISKIVKAAEKYLDQ